MREIAKNMKVGDKIYIINHGFQYFEIDRYTKEDLIECTVDSISRKYFKVKEINNVSFCFDRNSEKTIQWHSNYHYYLSIEDFESQLSVSVKNRYILNFFGRYPSLSNEKINKIYDIIKED